MVYDVGPRIKGDEVDVRLQPERFGDFVNFAKLQLESGDIDPVYPVLRRVYDAQRLEAEEAVWRTLLYVTFYDIGTAYRAWSTLPEPDGLPVYDEFLRRHERPPATGIERRSFRGRSGWERARAHVQHLLVVTEGCPASWVNNLVWLEGTSLDGAWERVYEGFRSLYGNGHWAAYKFCDLLKNVHGFPLEAPDIGHLVGAESSLSGPLEGAWLLVTKNPQARDRAVRFKRAFAKDRKAQRVVLAAARNAGVPFNGLDQLETALCDFSSLVRGSYYVGHDIDLMMDQLAKGGITGAGAGAEFWEARAAELDHRYLGERNGWFGVRKRLKKLYLKRRIIDHVSAQAEGVL